MTAHIAGAIFNILSKILKERFKMISSVAGLHGGYLPLQNSRLHCERKTAFQSKLYKVIQKYLYANYNEYQ